MPMVVIWTPLEPVYVLAKAGRRLKGLSMLNKRDDHVNESMLRVTTTQKNKLITE